MEEDDRYIYFELAEPLKPEYDVKHRFSMFDGDIEAFNKVFGWYSYLMVDLEDLKNTAEYRAVKRKLKIRKYNEQRV